MTRARRRGYAIWAIYVLGMVIIIGYVAQVFHGPGQYHGY